ncbi:hypothetical protein Tco_0900667 [Tanacetum coccineum]
MPRECLKIIESKSKVRQPRNKAVVAKMSYKLLPPRQVSLSSELKDKLIKGPAPQTHGVSKTDFEDYVTSQRCSDEKLQNQGQNLQSQMGQFTDMLSKFVTVLIQLLLPSGTLLDTMPSANNEAPKTSNLLLFNSISEIKDLSPCSSVVTPIPKASIPYPSRRNDERARKKQRQNERI